MATTTIADFEARQWVDTEANWLAADPVIKAGQIVLTSDLNELRFGDGSKKYSELDAISGGGVGDLQVPQPKTWVEKWNDGGAGTVTSKVNEWGTGIFIVRYEESGFAGGPAAQLLHVTDVASDARTTGLVASGTSVNMANLYYDSTDATFKFNTNGTTPYLLSISRWEDDPDNLPLLEIPADPGLIKDWVEVYEDWSNTGNVTNAWGTGLYMALFSAGTSAGSSNEHTSTLRVNSIGTIASIGTTSQQGNDNGGNSLQLNASNQFVCQLNGSPVTRYIKKIWKFQDVAGVDAQLNPPVDGWETVFDDDTNTGAVTNIWGAGKYEIALKDFSGTADITLELTVKESDIGSGQTSYSPSYTYGGDGVAVVYNDTSGAFVVSSNGGYGGNIIRIRKFNSLVNVYHSYHPDPRQVAQKDWVEVYNEPTNTGNVTNVWGDGDYKIVLRESGNNNDITVSVTVETDTTTITGSNQSAHGRGTNRAYAIYNKATKLFSASSDSGTYYIYKILKWQDSQASDAPRTVLDDGWETVWEDQTSTSASVDTANFSDFGVGEYRAEIYDSGNSYWRPAWIYIADTTVTNTGTIVQSASNVVLAYHGSTGLLDTQVAGRYIRKVSKFTGLLCISAQYDVTSLSDGENQVASIDTTTGDVDVASYFADTSFGKIVELYNSGPAGGYHLTNCPDSIEIGGGKFLRFRYVDGWKYEDVIIDEYSDVGSNGETQHIIKRAGGGIKITTSPVSFTTSQAFVFIESIPYEARVSAITLNKSGGLSTAPSYNSLTSTGVTIYSGTGTAHAYGFTVEGRWKTGV